MRTEKRPLNLAALGVNGPAEGTTSKSKNSGPGHYGPGVLSHQLFQAVRYHQAGETPNGEWREVTARFAMTEEATENGKNLRE